MDKNNFRLIFVMKRYIAELIKIASYRFQKFEAKIIGRFVIQSKLFVECFKFQTCPAFRNFGKPNRKNNMLVISDIVHQVVKDVVVFGNDQQLLQPVTADKETCETSLVVTWRGDKSSECLNLPTF